MRKYLVNIFLLMLLAMQVAATPANVIEQFNSANKLADQKKYKEALELYIQIEKSNNLSSNLYENMANVEIKQGHIATALLYLEKAKKYTSHTELINDKIQTILSSQHLEYEQISISISEYFAKQLGLFNWTILAIVGSILLSLFVVIYFSMKQKISLKVFAIIILLGFLSLFLFHHMASTCQEITTTHNWAIVIEDKTALKNTPDNSSSTNYEVQAGSKFKILDKIGNWYLLQNQFGKKGWAATKNISLI